jgi:hypothetical protein
VDAARDQSHGQRHRVGIENQICRSRYAA